MGGLSKYIPEKTGMLYDGLFIKTSVLNANSMAITCRRVPYLNVWCVINMGAIVFV